MTAAREAGAINGVVHDKLYLPGLVKLKRLVDSGFFGRILSVRGEFGYWVFEGDLIPAQRPSWNYRAEDGGGMVLDMFCHWNYVLENLFGRVEAVTAKAVTHIPERWDEQGTPTRRPPTTPRTASSSSTAASSPRSTRPGRCGSTAASWSSSRWTAPTAPRWPACSAAASSRGPRRRSRSGTPICPPTRTSGRSGKQMPDNEEFPNGFRAQWEQFLRDVDAGRPHAYDLAAGVRGLQLVEAGLRSSAEGPPGRDRRVSSMTR